MNKKLFISTVAVGAILGVGGFAIAASPNQTVFPKFEFSKGIRSEISNRGSDVEIKAAKRAVVQLFEADYSLGNLTPKQQKEIGDGADQAGLAKLRKDLDAVWVKKSADDYYTSIIELFKSEDGQALDSTFTSVKFVVEKWEGVQVGDLDATVLFTGHYETNGRAGKSSDSPTQYLVTMNRDSEQGKWLLVERKGVQLED
jgi:hypothetical protein